jgi:hypothetical protein
MHVVVLRQPVSKLHVYELNDLGDSKRF